MAYVSINDLQLEWDDSTLANPKLIMPYSRVDDPIQWENYPLYGSSSITPWLLGLMHLIIEYMQMNPDPDPQLFISLPEKQISTNTNGQTFIEYSYQVVVRANDPTGSFPDGDQLLSS